MLKIVLLLLVSFDSYAGGMVFFCQPQQVASMQSSLAGYFATLGIPPDEIVHSSNDGVLRYTLNTPTSDFTTLDFSARPELTIQDIRITLPARNGGHHHLTTVSQKEIVLALLQHGRWTEFKAEACDIKALKDHVGVRQNIVAWAQELNWIWPNGGEAKWNKKYWRDGTPEKKYPLYVALNDVFMNQRHYAIGCYTAAKLVVMQGVLDYYRRIKQSPQQAQRIEERLLLDQEPLVGIEPARLWAFEKDFDASTLNQPGKLLKIIDDVKPMNFVPGDWVYFLNTDTLSYEKIGYEGSNAIYLGRGQFSDYYNDHHHAYSYFEKLNEVYQWRNGVFSLSRDFLKIKPVQDAARLGLPPSEGGLLNSVRVVPYYFSFGALPVR